ncbi:MULTISPECIES: hypothetical protein [Actinosynnema]|uniref:hypothetical protein n=1 Tax=Actinosynnema TaxID=40566 RepID=UPI0020A46EC4|nr:hypothetical protein [Actinosynnema pretiosum]MCP2092878.1 hypothetical protein [Actinosynnema pretiosum]
MKAHGFTVHNPYARCTSAYAATAAESRRKATAKLRAVGLRPLKEDRAGWPVPTELVLGSPDEVWLCDLTPGSRWVRAEEFRLDDG